MNDSTTAYYYPAHRSQRFSVSIYNKQNQLLEIHGIGTTPHLYPIKNINVPPRVANIPRSIYLSDGAKLEVADNIFVDEMLRSAERNIAGSVIYKLENTALYSALLALLAISLVVVTVTSGIPYIAKQVAFALPDETNRVIGQNTLEVMDETLFHASSLDTNTRDRLTALFNDMLVADADTGITLEFRRSPATGPNAFALPSGIIVITDELINLSDNDKEIVAILAHELGHLRYRHGLRAILQGSISLLIISALTGDITSSGAYIASLPALLINAKYSREFEDEADDFALEFLISKKISTEYFADILKRIEGSIQSATDYGFMSSHPDTAKRIVKFMKDE